jgi:hypothetical protein
MKTAANKLKIKRIKITAIKSCLMKVHRSTAMLNREKT